MINTWGARWAWPASIPNVFKATISGQPSYQTTTDNRYNEKVSKTSKCLPFSQKISVKSMEQWRSKGRWELGAGK